MAAQILFLNLLVIHRQTSEMFETSQKSKNISYMLLWKEDRSNLKQKQLWPIIFSTMNLSSFGTLYNYVTLPFLLFPLN